MIHPDKALKLILERNFKPKLQKTKINESLHKVLGENIISTFDSPPFNRAAMDGYALKNEDIQRKKLSIIETIPAGYEYSKEITSGECYKIMTGAMVPDYADTIIRNEFASENENCVELHREDEFVNIAFKGENIKKGEVVMKPKFLKPGDIGVIASFGYDEVQTAVPPRTGIIVTGSELKSPGEKIKPTEIYNSNSFQLEAQLSDIAVPFKNYGIAKDCPESILQSLKKAEEESDLILISGGVSAGDYDFVPEISQKAGFKTVFHKSAVKPGKPTLFAEKKDKFLFGLPGNPVSVFVIFEIFVKPFIFKMMGLDFKPVIVSGVLEDDIKRKNSERVEYVPVYYEGGKVFPLRYHGSGHITVLSKANSLLRLEQKEDFAGKGSEVRVRLLNTN